MATLLAAFAAAWYAGHGWMGIGILSSVFALCAAQGLLFLQKMTLRRAKFIEYASAFWTIAMYLTLGGVALFVR
jgi:4-hydroxybenzoate polyprenyltransferase